MKMFIKIYSTGQSRKKEQTGENQNEELEGRMNDQRNDKEREEEIEEKGQEHRPGKRGRKPGISNEEIENTRKVELRIREEKLREQGVRRSERIETRKHQANVVKHITIPWNFTQAMDSTKAKEWHEAMKRKMESMEHHKMWKIVPRSKDMKIMKSKWIYSLKDEKDSGMKKYKARLVGVGCVQREGIDYEESFSPVIKLESFRALMAIASVKKMHIKQYDVKTAYLYGHLDKPVYMEPEGFVVQKEKDHVYKVEKSIYRLPQSGRQWNEEFDGALREIGLHKIPSVRI